MNKLGICEEEADESGYWLELLVESGQLDRESVTPLIQESHELTAIFSSSRMTARAGIRR